MGAVLSQGIEQRLFIDRNINFIEKRIVVLEIISKFEY